MTASVTAPSLMLGLLVALLPVTGAVMALTPFLMPKRECFAVTVPDAAASDPKLRGLKLTYAALMAAVTAMFTVGAAIALAVGAVEASVGATAAGLIVVCLLGYGLMLYFRQKVIAYKRERGWTAQGERAAALLGDEPVPHALSLRWDLLFVPLIVACLLVCVLGYDSMPDRIPRQIDFAGNVTTYFEKSPLIAAFPAFVVAFIDGCLALSHWMILRSRRPVDPAAPVASAWAYGMFAKAQSALIVAGGVLLGFVGLFMALSFVGAISIQLAGTLSLVPIVAVVVASVALSLAYGQNGSRLLARMGASDAMPRDDDRFWKLGIFYVNPADASLVLPERFGIGWTINWGRPGAWALVGATVLVTAGFVAAALLLA